jgi:catalase
VQERWGSRLQEQTLSTSSSRYELRAVLAAGGFARVASIGAIVAALALVFAYVASWLSPHRLTPTGLANQFERNNGEHPGFRRNHSKGLCAVGDFTSNGAGARLSKAQVFQPGQISPVMARFAVGSGMPFLPDGPKVVRSLAISVRPQGGSEWRSGMNDIPVFPVRNAEEFYGFNQAQADGKADPKAVPAYLGQHPEVAQAVKAIGSRTLTSGFADDTYHSINAFRFTNADGTVTLVRWSLVALDTPASMLEAPADEPNYIFNALSARVKQGPVQYKMMVTVAAPGDITDDATVAWPADRRQIEVGTLTLKHAEAEAPGNCRDINYDPTVLPPGIAPSDDPLISARSAVYSVSFTRRAGEKKVPSAVRVAQ